jgi:hypothetical protein
MSENSGMEEDTQSNPAGSGQSKQIQCHLEVGSEASAEGFLKSHVFPSMSYAAKCGNNTQLELGLLGVFINECRRKLLQVRRLAADSTVITNEELSRRCKLPSPLDLLARRRKKIYHQIDNPADLHDGQAHALRRDYQPSGS